MLELKLLSVLGKEFMVGLTPLGPAVRLFFKTMPTALTVMLLGVAVICVASEIDQVVQRPLVLIGEATTLAGGMLMLVGSVCAWWLIFQGSFGHRR
ncbi:MAG: hypothetical protein NTV11_19545 [Rhodocyclales bacterium]|nr:hypothetical protein [Rhodocyclales bacterium]